MLNVVYGLVSTKKIVLLWLQLSKELWMLYLFAAVYGFTHSGFFTVISPIVAEYFGLRSHGLLFGMAVFGCAVGGFIGPIFIGSIFDLTASYRVEFWVCLCAAAAGLGLILSLRPARSEEKATIHPETKDILC
jgi:MFS family permease